MVAGGGGGGVGVRTFYLDLALCRALNLKTLSSGTKPCLSVSSAVRLKRKRA